MPAGSELTLRAKRPIKSPVMTPLSVEPITMPVITGAVSGAETSALSPSKMPRTPPRVSAKTGLFMSLSLLLHHRATPPAISLTPGRDEDQDAHGDVRGDEKKRPL